MYKEIFNLPFFEHSNRHMNEGLTLLIAISPCPPSHLGTWLCEGGGHGSEAAVSGKLV
jgi:hypothetical protein